MLPKAERFLRRARTSWKRIALVVIPILLLPLILVQQEDPRLQKPLKCAYVVVLMAIFWCLELVPVPVTGLFPIVLLPMLSLSSAEEASAPYFREENVLFVCCLMIAIAVENSNLHRRIGLRILSYLGVANFNLLILAFMAVTAIFAIFINNTAAVAMMIPIGDAVVNEAFPPSLPDEVRDTDLIELRVRNVSFSVVPSRAPSISLSTPTHLPSISENPEIIRVKKIVENNKKCLYLCLAYAATIGSTASLTSNGPNLVLKRFVEKFGEDQPIDYAPWLGFCFPGVIVMIVCVWFSMKLLYMRPVPGKKVEDAAVAKNALAKKYKELGSLTFHEGSTLVLVMLLVFLWMFRSPNFVKGWAQYFCPDPGSGATDFELQHCLDMRPKDSTAAMAVLLLMFMIPSKPFSATPSSSLVTWELVQKKLAWGLVFMRGGGFSIADAFESSRLSCKISTSLSNLHFMGPFGVGFVFTSIASVLTEFLSNTATNVILLPIARDLASSVNIHINPLALMIPITLVCSLAFVLPVGTPPNSLVYAHLGLRTSEMVIPGLIVKVVCSVVMVANIFAVGLPMFDLTNTEPPWLTNATQISHEC